MKGPACLAAQEPINFFTGCINSALTLLQGHRQPNSLRTRSKHVYMPSNQQTTRKATRPKGWQRYATHKLRGNTGFGEVSEREQVQRPLLEELQIHAEERTKLHW